MSPAKCQFVVPEPLSIQDVVTKLQRQLRCRQLSVQHLQRTLYDSFDWRLYNRNCYLATEIADQETAKLRLYLPENTVLSYDISPAYQPGFCWELPAEAMQKRLHGILEMRTVLPVVTLNSSCHHLVLLNKEQKTTVRIRVEECCIDGDITKQLPPRVQIIPLKGYHKAFNRVQKFIEHELQLVTEKSNWLTSALALAGHRPGEYSGKFLLQLDPEVSAKIASKQILLYLLEMIEINEAGTKADLDSEFLHDFRVAIRRTRSAITQVKKVLPDAVMQHFRSEFAWLGGITSPTRDADVYLLNYEGYRDSLPVSMQPHLRPLHSFLKQQQQVEQKKLRRHLNSKRYKNLLAEWRDFLQTPTQVDPDAVKAVIPVKQLADQRIWRVYRQVLRDGAAINPETPVEALHELRKTCKKLRYLMEFFHSLYPQVKIKKLISYLKSLQNNLGDIQDYEVQADTLKHCAEQMLRGSKANPDTLMAIGVLAAKLEAHQIQARDMFTERFATFSSANHQHRFRALFRNPPTEEN